MTVLSPRLAAVAALVLPGLPLADIGTDHAYLPIALVTDGTVPTAVAGDVAAKPLRAARHNVTDAGLANAIAVREGSGLSVLAPGEAQTIVIAGMGGCLIRDIIAAAPEVARAACRLVLQPMRDAAALRRWLWADGWSLCAERMAREGDHYYTVLAAEACRRETDGCDAGCSAALAHEAGISEDIAAEIGPLVIAGPDPLLIDWVRREIGLIAALDAEIAGAPGSAPARRGELANRRRELETLCARLAR